MFRRSSTRTTPTTRTAAASTSRGCGPAEAEIAFVGIGPGAGRWLKEAGPAGAVRIRAKMARAVELATVLGNDQALGLAATAGRFADDDLLSILGHIADSKPAGEVVRADEAHSVQNGTIGWQALGR
ncbi:hypothetical protein OG625_38540 [Streptomyces sp. NBC_01351]|uniref:hypothetical protein n=1 Tax=Streptomyces sp. NBC_01351 TaxID=2903833 RepID=UPI002E31BB14|nr:hypothetical protein [Streptomyces sp. NBC_01351]